MYSPLRWLLTPWSEPCIMYTRLMYAMMLCMKLLSWKEGYIVWTVNDYAHTLILNNHYLTLLKVYKPAAWTSTLHTVLVRCTTSFRGVQLMYCPLRWLLTPWSEPCIMYTRLMYAMMLCMKLLSWKEGYIVWTVNDYAHTLILNNHYLTLLKVYKPAAWTSTLHTVLVRCTTSFRGVQLMYCPLRWLLTPWSEPCIMYTRLMYAMMLCMKLLSWKEGYIVWTVNDYAHTLILNNQYLTLLKVYKPCCLDQYTSYSVGKMYDKFHGCTGDVQSDTLIVNNPRANPALCTHA